ncbi:hypothetical protein [Pseudomonas sp.]|uniref:hypothetical protein n=1 Tax=Pseudomonas sp. TaxID=306 RepID=UPI0027298EDE|nr:hypothetical protein [Pseudomonas sp.]
MATSTGYPDTTDRRVEAALARVCETARAEIAGFEWLTHEAETHRFSSSLQVIWVFDTRANLARALETGHGRRMYELTAEALAEAGVKIGIIEAHVRFDSEEECRLVHGGDWRSRLDMLRSASP